MARWNGDVHSIYASLSRRYAGGAPAELPELAEVRRIRAFYAGLSPLDRRLLLAKMRKEEKGIGMIPIALSTVPLLLLAFARNLQDGASRLGPAWPWLLGLFIMLALGALYLHHRQRAWAALHLSLLQDSLAGAGKPRHFTRSVRPE